MIVDTDTATTEELVRVTFIALERLNTQDPKARYDVMDKLDSWFYHMRANHNIQVQLGQKPTWQSY